MQLNTDDNIPLTTVEDEDTITVTNPEPTHEHSEFNNTKEVSSKYMKDTIAGNYHTRHERPSGSSSRARTSAMNTRDSEPASGQNIMSAME